MDSDGDSLAVVSLAKQSTFTRFLKTCRRRLLGCEGCSRKSHSIAELEISAANDCQMCSLFLDAVRCFVPSFLLQTGRLGFDATRFVHFGLYWYQPKSLSRRLGEGFAGEDESIHLDIYTLKGKIS